MTAVAATTQLPPTWTKENFTTALEAVDGRIHEIRKNLGEYRAKEAEYTQKVEAARRPHEAAAAALQTKAEKIQTELIDTLTAPENFNGLQALVQKYEGILNTSVDADKLPDDAKAAVEAAVDGLKQLQEQFETRAREQEPIDQAEEKIKRAQATITSKLAGKLWVDNTPFGINADTPISDTTKEDRLQELVKRAKDPSDSSPFTADEITEILSLLELRNETAAGATPGRIKGAVAAIKQAQTVISGAIASLDGKTVEEARAALPAKVTTTMVEAKVGELKSALEAAKTKADELVGEANSKAQEAADGVEKPEGFTPPGHVKTQADDAEAAAKASADRAKPWGQVQAAGIILSVITGLGLTGLALVHFRVLQKGLVRLQGTRLSDFATKATQTLNRWADATAAIGTTKLFAPVASATAISVGVAVGGSVVKGQLEHKAWSKRVEAAAARYEALFLEDANLSNAAFKRPEALKALKDNHQETFYSALAAAL